MQHVPGQWKKNISLQVYGVEGIPSILKEDPAVEEKYLSVDIFTGND